jgi:endonuclease/exonuclease/phosphatase family metal-dependent hydrolase
MRRPVRVLTWNVQGSHGLDVPAVADVIRGAGVDVIALQEVQRRQAQRLAAALSVRSRRWALKHWPVVHRPEGLAVLTPHPIVQANPFVLRRAWFWAWQRRVGVDVTVDVAGGGRVRVLDVHLSPHGDEAERRREAAVLVERGRRGDAPIVVGDLNELPGSGAVDTLATAGWVDAWTAADGTTGGGATNWTAGDRRGRPATQRIDYVLVPPRARVAEAAVIDAADMDRLSDHLPLVVAVDLAAVGR